MQQARLLIAAVVSILSTASLPAVSTAQANPPAQKPAMKEDLRYDGKSFAYWCNYLTTELKAERRIDAVRAMGEFGARGYGKEAAEVIVELVKEYKEGVVASAGQLDYGKTKATLDEQVILAVEKALDKIGPDAAAVLLANMKDPRIRIVAKRVLGENGNVPAKSIPGLVLLVQNKEKTIRNAAILILNSATSTQESLANVLRKAVATDKKKKAFVAALRHSLSDTDWDPKLPNSSMEILGKLGPLAKKAVPVLVEAQLRGSDRAAAALKAIKPTPEEIMDAYVACLKNYWPEVRGKAANELGKLGPKAKKAISPLLYALQRPIKKNGWRKEDVESRVVMTDALIKIGAPKRKLADALIKLMDENREVDFKRKLLRRLVRIENDPNYMVPVLIKLLQKADPKDVAKFGDKWHFSYSSSEFHGDIYAVLGEYGSKAKAAVPILITAYKEFQYYVYQTNYGPNRKPYVVVKWIPSFQGAKILTTVGKIGPDAKAALPILKEALQSGNADLRRAAAEAIRAITQGKKEGPLKGR